MEWSSRMFLRASLIWLAVGVSLGIGMAIEPRLGIFRTAHLHMNLLGFVAMMIFGVAYHVVPRFTGHPLHSRRLSQTHWWLANAGLVLFAAGLASTVQGAMWARSALIVGGTLSALGAYTFVYNIWRTIDGRPANTNRRPPMPATLS